MNEPLIRIFRFENISLFPEMFPNRRESFSITVHITLANESRPILRMDAQLYPPQSKKNLHLPTTSVIAVLKENAPSDPLVMELARLHAMYDRNDMRPGTARQQAAIADARHNGTLPDDDSTKIINYLKSIQLFVDDSVRDADGMPHRYGHGWVYTKIPDDELRAIKALIRTGHLPS